MRLPYQPHLYFKFKCICRFLLKLRQFILLICSCDHLMYIWFLVIQQNDALGSMHKNNAHTWNESENIVSEIINWPLINHSDLSQFHTHKHSPDTAYAMRETMNNIQRSIPQLDVHLCVLRSEISLNGICSQFRLGMPFNGVY